MLGDIINIRGEYFDTSKEILVHLRELLAWNNTKMVIGIQQTSILLTIQT